MKQTLQQCVKGTVKVMFSLEVVSIVHIRGVSIQSSRVRDGVSVLHVDIAFT